MTGWCDEAELQLSHLSNIRQTGEFLMLYDFSPFFYLINFKKKRGLRANDCL